MRTTMQHEDEPFERSQLCVRVMEAFFAKVTQDSRFDNLQIDLYSIYIDVLADELAPYAFYLASALFSREQAAIMRRRAWEEER